MTLTATDIPGADLSELLVLFWHRYREKCLEQARDCDLSCLPSIQNTLNHLGLVPGSLGNRWKAALGSWLGLLPQHVTGMSSILRCSRSYFNRFSFFAPCLYRQVSCPSPQSHELCNRYGFSHAQVSNHPLANFAIHYNTKEQPDVMSRQSNSFALVCNWLIAYAKFTCKCRVLVNPSSVGSLPIRGILPTCSCRDCAIRVAWLSFHDTRRCLIPPGTHNGNGL